MKTIKVCYKEPLSYFPKETIEKYFSGNNDGEATKDESKEKLTDKTKSKKK